MKSTVVNVVILLCFASTLTAVSVYSGEPDLDEILIRDMPKERIEAHFGRETGLKLRPHELAKLATYRFTGDEVRLLAVLVDWSDRVGQHTPETFENFFFSHGIFPGGSVAEYFEEVSYGQLTVTGDIIGWINAGAYTPYYNFTDLFEVLDPIVDFSQYDGDGDGNVDAICFIRSGNGEEDSQDPNDIWSYAMISYVGWGPYDGVKILQWNTSPETRPLRNEYNPTEFSGVDTLNRIRVFCHELSHNLGLPDLYDYDNKLEEVTYYTPGDDNDHPLYDWCLMGYYGYGYFSLGSDIPGHLCGWNKMQLGWVEPLVLPDDFEGVIEITNVETIDDSLIFKLPIDESEGEYFLLEYRNPQSMARYDKLDSDFSCYFWPDLTYGCDPMDRGLLITHIHDSLVPVEEWFGLNDGTPTYPHYTVVVEDAGYNPARPHTYNPEGHVTDSAQWWYPYETRKGALFSSDVDGQSVFGPTTVPSSDGYGGRSAIYVEVLSMDDERIYVYVDMNVDESPCCEVRGDVDDDGSLTPLDATYIVDYFWRSGAAPLCSEEADVNGDDNVNPLDAIYLVNYFWNSGAAPAPCP